MWPIRIGLIWFWLLLFVCLFLVEWCVSSVLIVLDERVMATLPQQLLYRIQILIWWLMGQLWRLVFAVWLLIFGVLPFYPSSSLFHFLHFLWVLLKIEYVAIWASISVARQHGLIVFICFLVLIKRLQLMRVLEMQPYTVLHEKRIVFALLPFLYFRYLNFSYW